MAKKSSESSQPARLIKMTSADIKNRQWSNEELKAVRGAVARQAAGDDSLINYDDIPKLTADQLANMVRFRDVKRKIAVSVPLDPQVLDWLKGKGEGHLTRINDILLNLMEAEEAAAKQ